MSADRHSPQPDRYANVPSWVDPDDWACERQILLVSFIGYLMVLVRTIR